MKITIPTSQSEIKLKDYVRAQGKSEREQIAIYLNLDLDTLEQLPASVYDETLAAISNAMNEEQSELLRFFTIGSTEYGFIPDLNAIEAGAFAVAEGSVSDLEQAHIFLNCIYRPVKRKVGEFYSVGSYVEQSAGRMLDAPLAAYTSAIVFFYNLGNDLGIYTPNSTP